MYTSSYPLGIGVPVNTTLYNGFSETSKATFDKTLSAIKGLDKQTISNISNKLTAPAKNAWAEISTGKYSYPDAVSKFGYENVAEIVKVAGGTVFAEDQIL